jgi:TolA-binding protein
MAGYRLWEQGRYREAAKALEAVASKYPRHRRASYALNLAGRAYLDAGNATAAAQLFLQNYRNDKKGERAQDSLYYLGQSLMRLGKPAEACRVYRQLRTEYGPSLRDLLEQRLSQALADAKCPA